MTPRDTGAPDYSTPSLSPTALPATAESARTRTYGSIDSTSTAQDLSSSVWDDDAPIGRIRSTSTRATSFSFGAPARIEELNERLAKIERVFHCGKWKVDAANETYTAPNQVGIKVDEEDSNINKKIADLQDQVETQAKEIEQLCNTLTAVHHNCKARVYNSNPANNVMAPLRSLRTGELVSHNHIATHHGGVLGTRTGTFQLCAKDRKRKMQTLYKDLGIEDEEPLQNLVPGNSRRQTTEDDRRLSSLMDNYGIRTTPMLAPDFPSWPKWTRKLGRFLVGCCRSAVKCARKAANYLVRPIPDDPLNDEERGLLSKSRRTGKPVHSPEQGVLPSRQTDD